jgi:hypothetical protein
MRQQHPLLRLYRVVVVEQFANADRYFGAGHSVGLVRAVRMPVVSIMRPTPRVWQ